MPEPEEIKSDKDEIKVPNAKKGISIKFILLGGVAYLSVLGLMIVGIVYFLKPDMTPVVAVQPAVTSTTNTNQSAQTSDNAADLEFNESVERLLGEPENVDISDLVSELKDIEYKSNLRYKMEQDSVARLLAERETRIAQAKLEQLKIETAKLIAARPRSTNTVKEKHEAEPGQNPINSAAVVVRTESKMGYKQLAKIYSSMKPADAAKILDKMETILVVNLLANMKDRSAAKILSSLKPEKAARISKKISDKFAQI